MHFGSYDQSFCEYHNKLYNIYYNERYFFKGFDGLGSVLQPAGSVPNQNNSMLANNAKNNQQSQHGSSALLTGDLESSLASLAENLSINKGPPPVKYVFRITQK